MKIPTHIRKSAAWLLALLPTVAAFTSCDAIYDDEGDCSAHYGIRFKYDMNMKFADAFPNAVGSVALYAFGSDGKFAFKKSESGERLKSADYSMELDVPAGRYDLIAWCGQGNGESFDVPEATVGETTAEQLTCTMRRTRDSEGAAHITDDLQPLWHGAASVSLTDEEGTRYDTLSLTKNTNVVRVLLQQLSGEAVDIRQFEITIEDDNGMMAHDNRLLADEKLTYHPWYTGTGTADMENGTKAQTAVGVALAELTVGRLCDDHNPKLTIKNTNSGDEVLSIPLKDYALLVKGHYNRTMSNQEYLDRQDEYNMTFFLTEDGRWADTQVIINSWRVVLNSTTLH